MIKPLRDRIVVLPIERIKSEVILVIMDERPNIGEIVAIGPLVKDVKVGDLIRYGDTSTNHLVYTKYEDAGVDYLILQEADVCWVVDDE